MLGVGCLQIRRIPGWHFFTVSNGGRARYPFESRRSLSSDSFGGKGFADQVNRLAPFGVIVCFGSLDGPPGNDVIDAMFRQMGNCFGIRFFSMHAFDRDRSTRREVTAKIINLLAEEKIKPPIWRRLPLADAGKAQALIESGNVLGKIILKPEVN